MGDENQAAWSLIYLSYAYTSTQEGAKEALGSCKQGLDYFRQANDLLGMAQALNILGELSRMLGDYESARLYYEDCLRVAQRNRRTADESQCSMKTSALLRITKIALRRAKPWQKRRSNCFMK